MKEAGEASGHLVRLPYLRAWRLHQGYSREGLIERVRALGPGKTLALSTLRRIETYNQLAQAATAVRLAAALGISEDELRHTDPTKLPPRTN